MTINGNSEHLSSLERQVDDQRQRVEQRIHDIQESLSPGQLLDQALRYTRNGGADFASSLGNAVTANPVPTALLGISLAWLMLGPKQPTPEQRHMQPSYPYARISSTGLQRTRHEPDESGDWYSHFIDDAGTEYRARADEMGRRVGHFVDTTGKTFGGFVDEAGHRIDQFRDEAGNALEDAASWASHTFHDVADAAGHLADNVTNQASAFGASVQSQAGQVRQSLTDLLHERPLVAGALAFAVGAALGASLPPTEQEDDLMGSQSDEVKRSAEGAAARLYVDSKERAKDLHDEVVEAVGSTYESAKSTVAGSAEVPQRPN